MGVRPTFMGFETATRGLMVNQKALDIVGNNVTNIGVTGYTRQRVDQVSLSVNMRYTRYNMNSSSFAGQGSGVYGISQIRDTFLDKRFREEYGDVGYHETASMVLEDLSAALDEISPSTMSTAMTKFQNAWKEMLGASADEVTGAANLYASANQIVQVFQQMSAKIDNVWDQTNYDMQQQVEKINTTLQKVALLNEEISRQQFNSMDPGNTQYRPLELLDERNVLLDELSYYAELSYEEKADGQVTVWMGAKGASNPPVVEGDKYDRLHLQVNDNDPQYRTVRVMRNSSGEDVNYVTGSVRATLDMLNGRGLAMNGKNGETFTEGILYFKDKIDQFSKTFADAFNNVIEYVDGAGQPYDPPRHKALFTFESDSYENAAGIRISAEWEADSSYIIRDVFHKLQPADAAGGGGDKENTYAAKAYNLFAATLDFGEFKGTVNDYISFYSVTKLGGDKEYSDTRLGAVSSIADNVTSQIQQISGVSFDEEGVDMMQYQKAYDAVSRVFTTLDEMLDKLINATGVVGR